MKKLSLKEAAFKLGYLNEAEYGKYFGGRTKGGDPRRPKDIEFDNAQAMGKLTPDDRDKVGKIQQMMDKEKTYKVGDKVMALMRGTKTNGHQNVTITSIDTEDGVLRNTDNPKTLLSVYSQEEDLEDEIFAREIKDFSGETGRDYEYGNMSVSNKFDHSKFDFQEKVIKAEFMYTEQGGRFYSLTLSTSDNRQIKLKHNEANAWLKDTLEYIHEDDLIPRKYISGLEDLDLIVERLEELNIEASHNDYMDVS